LLENQRNYFLQEGVQDRSIDVNDQILDILNESGIDMKLQGRSVDEANRMEGVGVAHKISDSLIFNFIS